MDNNLPSLFIMPYNGSLLSPCLSAAFHQIKVELEQVRSLCIPEHLDRPIYILGRKHQQTPCRRLSQITARLEGAYLLHEDCWP